MSTHRRETESHLEMSDRRIYRVASGTTIVIAICAAVLSYSALRHLAIQSGIEGTLAYLFPLTLDGLILIGALMVLFAATRGRRSWGGVFLTGLGVISSVAGNVAVSPNTLTARLVHAAAPIVLFLAVEAVTSLMRKMQNETMEAARQAEKNAEVLAVSTPTAASFFEPEKVSIPVTKAIEELALKTEEPVLRVPLPEPVQTSVAPILEEQIQAEAVKPEKSTEPLFTTEEVSVLSDAIEENDGVLKAHEESNTAIPSLQSALSEPMLKEDPISITTVDPKSQSENEPTPVRKEKESSPKIVSTLTLRPDMTARQRVGAYIEAGYADISSIADEIGGDRKYIRKLAREELDRRGLVSV